MPCGRNRAAWRTSDRVLNGNGRGQAGDAKRLEGMSWAALGGAAALQLFAGIVRVRAWFHVIRHSCPDASDLRYRDVVLAQLGGSGWNAVLPARAGDAVKIAIVSRSVPGRRLAMLAATLVPPALVEAAFTGLLVVGLLAAGVVSLQALTSTLPPAGTALVVAGAVCVGLVAALVFRRRLERLWHEVRSGLAILRQPPVVATRIVPWLVVGRVLRLFAFAFVLVAAGVPFALGPALALMALQGATPSAGAAATAARIALLAAVLAATGAADVPPADVAAALAAAYVSTTVVNLVVSAAVIAWLLRTTSPRRIIGYARSALQRLKRERARRWVSPTPADGTRL
jgi:hypothetical protein